MNDLQKMSFNLWWKVELFLAGVVIGGLWTGDWMLVLCAGGAMAAIVWVLRSDWKARGNHGEY